MTVDQLRRLRWAVRGAFALALAVSIAANVLHAADNTISRAISAWPPLALLLTVELISRIPARSKLLSWVRIGATAVIATIAAWISYWHMVAVTKGAGERDYAAQYLWPLTVDGLLIVASICLVEIGTRLTAHTGEPEPVEPLGEPVYVDLPPEREPVRGEPYLLDEPEPVEPVSPGMGPVAQDGFEPFEVSRWEAKLSEPLTHADPWLKAEPVSREPQQTFAEPRLKKIVDTGSTSAEKVALAHGAEPDATNQRIADLAGVSLATVKRHRPPRPSSPSA